MSALLKPALRKEITRRLSVLSSESVAEQSDKIQQRVIQSDVFTRSKNVVCYLNLSKEVSTNKLCLDVLKTGKKLFVPDVRKSGASSSMRMVQVTDADDMASFTPKQLGVLGPEEIHHRADAMDGPIDIIIMPGLGFDNKCHRLGRGKGYYDSYIRVLREQTMTTGRQMPLLVALALRDQIVEAVPVSEHDELVDVVVSVDDTNSVVEYVNPKWNTNPLHGTTEK